MLFGLAVASLQLGPFQHPEVANAYQKVFASSQSWQNSYAYYSLKDYAYIRGQVNWPTRSMSGAPAFTSYKTMPWLAANTITGGSNTGDDMNTTGNVAGGRYEDGGSWGAGWAYPWALGSWTVAGGGAGFSGNAPLSGFTQMVSCNNLIGGGAPVIWGSGSADFSDQAYNGGLFARNGWTSTAPSSYYLFSNGTTFFRNTFDISAADFRDLTIGAGSQITFYAQADDWMQVYVNGVLIANASSHPSNTSSSAAVTFSPWLLHDISGGPNVIAIQVADKAVWGLSSGNSRGSGLCYNLTGELNPAPPPPPPAATLQPSVTSNVGIIPGATGTCATSPCMLAGQSYTFTPHVNNISGILSNPYSLTFTSTLGSGSWPGLPGLPGGSGANAPSNVTVTAPTVASPSVCFRAQVNPTGLDGSAGNPFSVCYPVYVPPLPPPLPPVNCIIAPGTYIGECVVMNGQLYINPPMFFDNLFTINKTQSLGERPPLY